MPRKYDGKIKNSTEHRPLVDSPKVKESAKAHPLLQLQRAAGNQAVQEALGQPLSHRELLVSQPDDALEQAADRQVQQLMDVEPQSSENEPATRDTHDSLPQFDQRNSNERNLVTTQPSGRGDKG
jgi:hypothetical protein